MSADAGALEALIEMVGFPATPTIVIGRAVLPGFEVNRKRIEELLR